MSTQAERIGKPFTLRYTADRVEKAERIREILPGRPEIRSAAFFFGVMELVDYVLIEARRSKIREIKEICDKYKIAAEDIGLES